MKTLIIIFCICLLSGCRLLVRPLYSNSAEPVTTATASCNLINTNNINLRFRLDGSKINDPEKVAATQESNRKFGLKPENFKGVDFANFVYRGLYDRHTIKNGKLEFENHESKGLGGGWLTLNGAYYINLNGGPRKEAVVIINEGHCGGSCDGGATIINFYESTKHKAVLAGKIITGCKACGCSLKSLTIKDKQIVLEQFGNCSKKSYRDLYHLPICKFCDKNLTTSIYIFQKSKLVKISSEVSNFPVTDVMNYLPLIGIED